MKCGRIHFGPIVMRGGGNIDRHPAWRVCANCSDKVSLEAVAIYHRTDLEVKRIIVAAHQANLDNLKRGAK